MIFHSFFLIKMKKWKKILIFIFFWRRPVYSLGAVGHRLWARAPDMSWAKRGALWSNFEGNGAWWSELLWLYVVLANISSAYGISQQIPEVHPGNLIVFCFIRNWGSETEFVTRFWHVGFSLCSPHGGLHRLMGSQRQRAYVAHMVGYIRTFCRALLYVWI